ncbi:MAG TPA: HAD family phosphatase [Dongiaceae bacterium]|nr:HAD family phosphatase [Dongiaceae bacterium]
MKGLQAVIFDMDGVVVDSEPQHERAFLEVMRALGYADAHGLRFSDYVGRSDRQLWVDFVAKNQPRQAVEELAAMKRAYLLELIRREQRLFAGLPALMAKLAGRYPMALASGSERTIVEEVLRVGNLAQFFAAVVTDTEVPRGKPAPDIFLRAAQLLGVAPEKCCVIEDSKPGVAAGLAAGMQVIAITNTHPAAELRAATRVAQSYEEIGRLLIG